VKLKLITSILFCSAIFFSACSSKETSLFKDSGHSIDSLKNAYQAKNITFDKWEATGVTDSTFSICFIDAKKVPLEFETSMKEFISIGKSTKYALKDISKYNSYQIVFVETHEGFGESHRAGTTLRSKDL